MQAYPPYRVPEFSIATVTAIGSLIPTTSLRTGGRQLTAVAPDGRIVQCLAGSSYQAEDYVKPGDVLVLEEGEHWDREKYLGLFNVASHSVKKKPEWQELTPMEFAQFVVEYFATLRDNPESDPAQVYARLLSKACALASSHNRQSTAATERKCGGSP
jgi:hypothetical protein